MRRRTSAASRPSAWLAHLQSIRIVHVRAIARLIAGVKATSAGLTLVERYS
jgi:hypothetical protein